MLSKTVLKSFKNKKYTKHINEQVEQLKVITQTGADVDSSAHVEIL